MKKLERPPAAQIYTAELFNAIRSEEGNTLLKKINEEYLYWDKGEIFTDARRR